MLILRRQSLSEQPLREIIFSVSPRFLITLHFGEMKSAGRPKLILKITQSSDIIKFQLQVNLFASLFESCVLGIERKQEPLTGFELNHPLPPYVLHYK